MPTQHDVNVTFALPVPEDYEREAIKSEERIVKFDDNRFQVVSNPRLMLHIENTGDNDEKIVIELSGKRADMYLQMFDIYICPMLNPDGVANGVRRHLENRADLNRDIETNKQMTGSENDPELQCHFRIIDEVQPDIYAQIHNLYKEKHRDILLMASPEHAEIFYGFMPSMEKHLKLFGVAAGHEGTVGHFCHKKDPSCVACSFEFPWFGRSAEDMREVGQIALEALLNTKIWIDQNPKGEYHCVHTLCRQLKDEKLQSCP